MQHIPNHIPIQVPDLGPPTAHILDQRNRNIKPLATLQWIAEVVQARGAQGYPPRRGVRGGGGACVVDGEEVGLGEVGVVELEGGVGDEDCERLRVWLASADMKSDGRESGVNSEQEQDSE